MGRTADPQIRRELLERAVDYVFENGLADLSLRPLATALGVSPGLLLYHFGSKEQLLIDIIAAGRIRQQKLVEDVDDLSEVWKILSAPRWMPAVRLFFEVYALAIRDPQRFPGFLEAAVDDWLDAIAPTRDRDARADATLQLALFRGLLLDLCATGDRKRITRALERHAKAARSRPSRARS
ncbi:MAG TPA: TetR/AcrR family transcriptional regulator [Candidatus Aquilonibacter sp.]